ncbi:MAG: hypothetical protein ACRCS3_12380 [Paracoccaceae bacterium]
MDTLAKFATVAFMATAFLAASVSADEDDCRSTRGTQSGCEQENKSKRQFNADDDREDDREVVNDSSSDDDGDED